MKRTKRFRRTFSLRIVFLAIPLVAVVMAYNQSDVMRLKRQHHAARFLIEEGASLEWREMQPGLSRSFVNWLFGQDAARHCVAIHAESINLSDYDLRHLRDMPYVQRLYIDDNPISDDGLEYVAGLKQLRELSIWGTDIGNEGVRKLEDMSTLESLVLCKIAMVGYGFEKQLSGGWEANQTGNLTADCLEHLDQLPNLRYLRFSFPLTPALGESLSNLKKVKIQILCIDGLNDEKMAALTKFPELESLVIQKGTIASDGLSFLGSLKRLTHLRIASLQVKADGWRHATSPPATEILTMHACDIDEHTIKAIAGMSHLKTITLSPSFNAENRVDDLALANLGRLSNLQSLALSRFNFTGSCFEEIGRGCSNLNRLAISDSHDFNDGNLHHLSSIRSFKELIIKETAISGNGIANLDSLEQLTTLESDLCFNDDSIDVATRFQNLRQLSGKTFYISDRSVDLLANHPLRLWINGIAAEIRDARSQPGYIDRADGPNSGVLTDDKMALLLKSQKFQNVTIWCNEVSSYVIPFCFGNPGTKEIVTTKTPAEFFATPVPGVASMSVTDNIISISMSNELGHVIVTCADDLFPDSLLKQTFPDVLIP